MTDAWVRLLAERLVDRFGGRVLFVGLQGSRARGEGRPDSDIDAVILFDRIDLDTLVGYRDVLDGMPDRGLACGFVSGVAEISAWAPHDLFQFRRDTVGVLGDLGSILPPEGPDDAARAANSGACAIFHACVHNMVHGRSVDALAQLAKPCRFTLQAAVCARTGEYHRTLADLEEAAGPDAWALGLGGLAEGMAAWSEESDEVSARLAAWASGIISEFAP